MAITLTSLGDLAGLPFDDIIDVRSPAEWAEDHIPGSVNLPVLDNEERARVGTIYVQDSPFKARKLGAALVARNAAKHLEGPLAEKPGGWRPLVYCWRGGQRSGSFATILGQIGWRVETIAGGYKAYRGLVVQAVYQADFPARVVLLDGNTGSAKTEVLALLAARGVQVIDLEGLANHRGSLFGQRAGGQPSQKAFDGRLAAAYQALDPARPVVIEAESSKVGDLALPPPLWKAMRAAPRLHLAAPRAARAAYLTRAYADLIETPGLLARTVNLLRPQHAAERIEGWLALAAAGAYATLAEELMEHHYDPRYAKQRQRTAAAGDAAEEIATEDLSPAALERLADRIAARIATL